MNKKTYEFLLDNVTALDVVITGTYFSENPELEFDLLLEKRFLVPVSHSGDFYATINGCRRYIHELITGDGKPHYIYMDEDESFELSREEAMHYRIDYKPFAKLIRSSLNAHNDFAEMISGKLWLCGQAGRQLRELYLTRNAGLDANIRKALFEKSVPKRAIVFQLGIPDNELSEKFTEQKVWNLTELLSRNESALTFNRGPVDARIDDMVDSREPVKLNRGKKYQEHMAHLKRVLLDAFVFCLSNARRVRRGEKPVPVPAHPKRSRRIERRYEDFSDQHSLAQTTGIPESTITAIKKEWQAYKDEQHNGTFLALMDFLMSNRKRDSDEVFEFYDGWKKELRDAGFNDPE